MPVVPVLNENQVRQQPVTDAKFRPADFGQEQIGQAAEHFGRVASRAVDEQDQIFEAQDEAAAKKLDNEAVERMRDLLWTGDDAYFSKQGFDAGNARAPTEKAIRDLRGELIGKATSERQQRMFGDVFDRRSAQEFEGIARHAIGEVTKESERQSIARGVNSANEAVTYADEPLRRETAIQTGLSELRGRADKQGWAPEVLKAEEQRYRSGIWANIIDGKTRADPVTAMALLEQHRGDILPEDEQKLRDTLYAPMMERQAVGDIDAYQGVMSDAVPEVAKDQPGQAPTMARMVQITAFAESRHRDRNRDGSIVTSPKGAQGRMQVMPGTNRDPGFGVRHANDNSDEERARVGRDYLAAMMKRYHGDAAKAWAAYNGGPGRVDDAVASRGDGWLGAMPAETKAYVASNVAALGGGQTGVGRYAPRRDDLAGIYNWIDKQPWDFERKQQARHEADTRVSRNDMLLRRQEDAAHDQALDLVDRLGEGFTSLTQLPPAVQRSLSPEARHSFRALANQNAAPKKLQTDYGFYGAISDAYATNPKAFLQVSPVEARMKLDDGDFTKFMDWRRDVLGGGTKRTEQQVDHSRILSVTKDALTAEGIDETGRKPNERTEIAARRGAFVQAMSDRVREWQSVHGKDKAPTDDDLRRMAGNLLLDAGNSGKNVFEANNVEVVQGLGDNDRQRIVQALQAAGVSPTVKNVADAYRRWGAFGRAEPRR